MRVLDRHWGAHLLPDGGARFRLWAPGASSLRLRLDGGERGMSRRENGWFAVDAQEAKPGSSYAFVLPDGTAVPDPAARAQAGHVHGPSLLVDPCAYAWQTVEWRGRPWEEAVISEIHIGTFTPEGTFRAAIDRLDALVEVGITAVEIMPVAQFAGERGWGYDGVLHFAPHPSYGTPDDLRALVDAAHARGLMVFLDVVYNHFGPDGNYLHRYASAFFDEDRHTPWGGAIAYERSEVRQFFVENALAWLEEYRLDGFRFDAIDHIRDPKSSTDILLEIAERIRAIEWGRPIHLATEDNRNITRLHERDASGRVSHFTAEWNDDFHNAAHVIATGETEGYYGDFAEDAVAKLARSLAEGFAFQGEPTREGPPRGVPSGHLPPTAFVDFLQNHDQTGNRAYGERLIALAPAERVRALTAVLLLSPHVPLLFMGEEWGEVRPFAFFTDFHGDLAALVREGRRKEFGKFPAFEDAAARATIPDPNAPGTFEASKIDWERRASTEGRGWLDFVGSLLEIRHTRIVPTLCGVQGGCGRVIAAPNHALAVDWWLSGAVLRLRANLSGSAQIVPDAPGETLYATGTDRGALAPDGVLVAMESLA